MSELRRALYPTLRADALAIFEGAIKACNVEAAMERHLRVEGGTLVRPLSGSEPILLDDYEEVLVIALGKAAVPMSRALLRRLPKGVPVRGVCSGAVLPAHADERVKWFVGGHPLPNAESFASARAALGLLREADKRTLVFFLLSGGGSAMMELPHDPAISLEEMLKFHRALVGSGATISEINAVRRRLSAVKGGRLALAAEPARQVTLVVADVPVKDVEAVASSPTLPDHAGDYDSREIVDRYGLMARFPRRVGEWFERTELDAAPAPNLREPDYEVLLSNDDLVAAACEQAQTLGYEAVADNACDDWDYKKACGYLLKRFAGLQREESRVCLVSGGEVTVRLEGAVGRGGRNQHFALEAAVEMVNDADGEIVVLSAGSDGVDGNSEAAGAIADAMTVARARAAGIDARAALKRFDSGRVFAALGDAIVTGPTGNNLRDLRVLLGTGRAGLT